MASSNTNIQLSELDFNAIKSNFVTFLQSQNVLKDYDYSGSALSVLLDLLAYNTQYNAFYLNMVGNEMFLDSAIQRGSVVSHAKLMGYTPKSVIAPTAEINMNIYGVGTSSLTLPKYTKFMSEAIDGVNYTFLTTTDTTVNTANNVASFQNIILKQAVASNYSFTVNSSTNPTYTFEITDPNIDTTTLLVSVQQSSSNTSYTVFTQASNYLTLTGTSNVYFLQEGITGNYQLVFGDSVLGKQLTDGNIINVSFLSSKGAAAAGANNFALMDTIGGYGTVTISPVLPASAGGNRESISSIKFQAPKAFSSQNRAVSKQDYITVVQQNSLGFSFDAVNVWGGEENTPPVYGQVFISLKPTGAYSLTDTQKQRLIEEVIKPVSVLTVVPTIVDPDYTYLSIVASVYYNPTQTTLTSQQLSTGINATISNFGNATLNSFNSTFNNYGLLSAIQTYDNSIITSDFDLFLQKKFYPNLSGPNTYNFYFNTPLQKGILLSGVNSSPDMSFRDPNNYSNTITGVYIEEVPATTNGIDTISLVNPGFGYQTTPTVTIYGDGTGATAHAVLSAGSIKSIVVDSAGSGYTSAIVVITNGTGDTKGTLGAAVANLQGRYGTLRTYYNNNQNIKTILNSNIGTIDYTLGVIKLYNFNPLGVNNPLGQLVIGVKPVSKNVSSTYNGIITIDPYDPSAITVNMITKTS
jgi:hypothetical protein